MSEHWTARLSEYLDGELAAAETQRLEAHLATCSQCAATLEELRAVVTAAKSLPDAPPERDLWPGIAARLRPRTGEGVATAVVPLASHRREPRRRLAFTVPQLVAAGIALVLFSASGVWVAMRGAAPGGTEAPTPAVATATPESSLAFASWEAAVADLETEFERRRDVLDPATIQVVERNLAIIDQAIAESRRALEADPSSGFLNGYLAEAMRRKVDLLRQATRIQRADT